MQKQTDAELLDAYSSRKDEEAFGELMRRHGALVYRACFRVLKDPHAVSYTHLTLPTNREV